MCVLVLRLQLSCDGANVDVSYCVGLWETFILKPSERDPSCSLRMAELLVEAAARWGLECVNGDKEAVDALLSDPQVQAVSFVGSTTVGEYIYRTGCDLESGFRHCVAPRIIWL
ncbi:MAG: hypothetical protein CM1200mP41_07240 [Gammaproteobacteria bacterium]|nr:MAG: hypothetical protein CM1200mP41_07240 [Gammaproteobacteria bacterium]